MKDVADSLLEKVVEDGFEIRCAEIRQAVALADLAEIYSVDTETLIPELMEKTIHPGEEGVPGISEFLSLELGPALGVSRRAALNMVVEILNLKHRHPETWNGFCEGRIQRWQAIALTSLTCSLSRKAAGWVDSQLGPVIGNLSFGRLKKLVLGWVATADPELARREEESRRRGRRVSFGEDQGGSTEVYGVLASRDAMALDRTLSEMAVAMGESGDERTRDERRGTALGLLADPAAALAWLEDVGLDQEDPAQNAPRAKSRRRNPRGRTVVYVHLAQETLMDPSSGVARIEGFGPLTTASLPEFLSGTNVTVRPVVDDTRIAPVEAYEIPRLLRDAVYRQQAGEMFPFSSSISRSHDLDHLAPYQWDLITDAGQTRLDNLMRFSRPVHRVKTLGAWRTRRIGPVELEWISPVGKRYIVGPSGSRPPDRNEQQRE